jgi:hypothetical protein
MKIVKRIKAFFLYGDKKGKRMMRKKDITIKGVRDTQSFTIFVMIFKKVPGSP